MVVWNASLLHVIIASCSLHPSRIDQKTSLLVVLDVVIDVAVVSMLLLSSFILLHLVVLFNVVSIIVVVVVIYFVAFGGEI